MEGKGLKINLGKTKIMIGGEGSGDREESGKFPCGVCGKGVGSNSLQCLTCKKWVHRKCSRIKGSLQAASATFSCSKCLTTAHAPATHVGLDIGNGQVLERVRQFCYLGDTLNADGGAHSAVTARVRCAWKKFRELSPILTCPGASLRLKGKIYEIGVRSCMIYCCETWAMKADDLAKLVRTEMRMIRWMCGVSLRERMASAELRRKMGVEEISIVVRRNRLRWYGHVERKDDTDWVKGCTNLEVIGTAPRGRPRKTWLEVVRGDMKHFGLRKEDAQDRATWRTRIKGKTG